MKITRITLSFVAFCTFLLNGFSQSILDMNGCVKMYGDAEITGKGATYDAYISNECDEYMIVDKSEYKVKFKCVRESNGSEFNKTKDIEFPYVFMNPFSTLKKDKKGNDSGSYFFNEITSQSGDLGSVTKADFSSPSSNAIQLNTNDWTIIGQNGNINVSARVVKQTFSSWPEFDKYKVEFRYYNESSVKQETTTFFNYSVMICGLSFPGSTSVGKIKGNEDKTDLDRFDAIFNFEPKVYLQMGEGNVGASAPIVEPPKPDGEYTITYPSGSIKEKGAYLNGAKDGLITLFNESGAINTEITYVNGSPNGLAKVYYENGKLSGTIQFKEGNFHGEYIEFYEDGIIKSKSILENNRYHGLSITYYPSGKTKMEVNFVENKLSGIGKSYYETGELESKSSFVDDMRVGEHNSFYKSGKLKDKVNYLNDKQEGEWKEYYESGKLKAKCVYSSGKITGTYKEYYENAAVKLEVDYIDGEKQGLEKEYSKDGKVIKETMH